MVKITYLSHSCFHIKGEKHSIIIDPFLTNNPLAKVKPDDIKTDAVLVSHAHFDHLGDAVEIAGKNNAPVIGVFEVVNYCLSKGVQGHPMHIGGAWRFPWGRIKLTIAHHASTGDTGTLGNPCGFIMEIDGKKIYHSGDTGLFFDMKLIGEEKIDVALLPIGGNFTMDVEDAVKALKLLHPKIAIPMHYNTFDVIKADPQDFANLVKKSRIKTKVNILNIGETLELK